MFRKRIQAWRHSPLVLFLALLVSGSSLFAQTAPIVQRLSPNTLFYVEWRGKAFLTDAEKKNHVLQLMQDPAVAPLWIAAESHLQQGVQKNSGAAAAMILPDAMSLLDNPVVFGLVANPDVTKSSAPDKAASPIAFFFVYDTTGKTDLIQKWKALSQVGSKAPIEVAKYDFGGTSVEVRTTGKNVSYNAEAANYFLLSDRKQVIEDLITRFRSADRPATSIAQIPEYEQMQKYIGTDAALEFSGRIPNVSELTASDKNAKAMALFSKNIHLEKIHVVGGAVSFDGEAMRIRGAVLGDTSPGGPFDLAGASNTAFGIQPIMGSGPAFSVSRMNLAATYQLISGAVMGSLTPQQTTSVAAVEGLAQNFLGMPIADALGLFTGEIGSVSSYSDDGTQEQLYAATIQKPEAVLRILRAVIGSMIVGEDSSGATTTLDIAYPYKDPETGRQRKKFYYVAVTPQTVLVAPRKAMLRHAMQQLDPASGDPPPGGVFANPEFSQLRSLLPGKLSGLSGADFQQIPWDKVLANLENQWAEAAKQSNGQQPPDLSSLKPEVITQHLHVALSGWWKDASGVYFDSYIQ